MNKREILSVYGRKISSYTAVDCSISIVFCGSFFDVPVQNAMQTSSHVLTLAAVSQRHTFVMVMMTVETGSMNQSPAVSDISVYLTIMTT